MYNNGSIFDSVFIGGEGMVTRKEVHQAARAAGICPGDMVLVHSSFRSLGPVEGGAETVIAGLLDAIGPEGTLVLPTFAQKDFANAYETWHMDKPSDTGYLTEYFRTRPGSVRSDQATHSVAACGAKAQWLTQTHGHTHKLFGNMGDTPFSADSPWEKMYRENARILMLGVTPRYTTFRHYAEYHYVNDCLARLEGTSRESGPTWTTCGSAGRWSSRERSVPVSAVLQPLPATIPKSLWIQPAGIWT